MTTAFPANYQQIFHLADFPFYLASKLFCRTSVLKKGVSNRFSGFSLTLPVNLSFLGTFTFRYPIPCARFAPYAFAGSGAIFGSGGRGELLFASDGDVIGARNRGSETKAVGQFGSGFEVRFTPTVGLMNDFSLDVVAGPKNNFGMVRSGITIAFQPKLRTKVNGGIWRSLPPFPFEQVDNSSTGLQITTYHDSHISSLRYKQSHIAACAELVSDRPLKRG